MLLVFPASKEYSLEDEKTVKTSNTIKQKEVFLIDKDGYVARTLMKINAKTNEEYAKKLIELLIIGGKYENDLPNGFKAIIPSDTKINDVKIDNDNILIDLSSDFLELNSNNFQRAIEALTYNITTIDGIKYLGWNECLEM